MISKRINVTKRNVKFDSVHRGNGYRNNRHRCHEPRDAILCLSDDFSLVQNQKNSLREDRGERLI